MERRFGVELEVTGITMEKACAALRAVGLEACRPGYTHRVMNPWKVVPDGSVPNGCEVVSPIMSGEEGLAEVMVAIDALKAAGAGADRTCGLHVHIDAAGLGVAEIRNIVNRYAAFETEIDSFMPASRRANQNRYCKSVTELARASRFRNAGDVQTLVRAQDTRYQKVNLQNWDRYTTVEFRQHNGIVDADRAAHWVRFLDSFVAESVRLAGGGVEAVAVPVTTSAAPAGRLTFAQARALEMMQRAGGTTAEAMAAAMGVQVHSARAVITRVRQAGYNVRAARRNGAFRYEVVEAGQAAPARPARAVRAARANIADSLWAGIDAVIARFYRNRAAVLALA